MEERKLNFDRNEDPTIVEDIDGKIAKKVNDIYQHLKMNLGFCYEQLVEGKLTKGMMDTHLGLTEHYVMDFLKEMGYDGILAKESEKRHIEIRLLNQQNRELRSQLGEKVTNEDFRERSKNMCESVRRWWNIYGFGHTSEINFMEYGHIKVKFSGMLSEAYYDQDHDQTKEMKVNYLMGIGFDFDENSEHVLINDKNIETLSKLITDKYPSASIEQITTYHSSRSGRTYGDIIVNIHNLDDIK